MRRRIRTGAAVAGLAAGLLAAGGIALDRWIDATPIPPLWAPASPVAVDRDGVPLRVFLAADDAWRLPATVAQVDDGYIDLLVAYEDKRFYTHHGVDPWALLRAARDSLAAGKVVSGGSTLTMQVARLLQGGGTGRWSGKVAQARLALALERRLAKTDILDIYLRRAPMGGNLEGVRAASFTYFGKDARRLTPAEAALLVALPQSPETRRPDRYPGAARAARDRVIARGVTAGVLKPEDLSPAHTRPVPEKRLAFPTLAWHATRAARMANPQAQILHLDLDADLQASVEALLADLAPTLADGASAAVMIREIASGRTLVRAGAVDPHDTTRAGFVDMTAALRSPGSTLKPLIYALAFDAGAAHPETLIQDRPTDFGGYAPRNFDRGFQGPVSARAALQASLNVPAVAALDAIGPARVLAYLRMNRIEAVTPGGAAPGLSLALGGVGLTLDDLVTLYAELARAATGLPGPAPLSQRAAWYVADILRGAPPPDTGAGGEIAYKTGTSYGNRDAWALGFDGRHVVGVWVGRADGGAVPGMTGRAVAAPLLFRAFGRISPQRAALPGPPEDALTVAHAALPARLQHLSGRGGNGPAEGPPPVRISFPPDGARVVATPGTGLPLVARVTDGLPPFVWMVNRRVVAWDGQARVLQWPSEGPGYVEITVLDRAGRAASTRFEVVQP